MPMILKPTSGINNVFDYVVMVRKRYKKKI